MSQIKIIPIRARTYNPKDNILSDNRKMFKTPAILLLYDFPRVPLKIHGLTQLIIYLNGM